ncbi:MAG: glycosyltransferase, partial [Anaerolineae bacterium]|nr:glycosyltransferase [Anaerolineae bacterium]
MAAVSVIMPCHNRAFEILKVLNAYERQKGDIPFELIAVDDGSTDKTFEILSSYNPSRFLLKV